MKKTAQISLLLMVLSIAISVSIGFALASSMKRGAMVDFQSVYFATRCLIQHHDPYDLAEFKGIYQSEGVGHPPGFIDEPEKVTWFINVPTVFIIAPLAVLPWEFARVLWALLLIGSFLTAAFLIAGVAMENAPAISLFLTCIVLANSEIVFGGGNTAGIVVSFTLAAAWCFLKQRFVPLGILCMVVALAIKPHDAGLVWLYFLLSGGANRKRALQILAIYITVGAAAVLWISQVAPHWMQEWSFNLAATSAPGTTNDPGLSSAAGVIVDLQAVIAVFRDDPRIYNPVSYLVCGALILLWVVVTLRSRFSAATAWYALAAIAPLTILVTYHRPYDARLILLTIPACAMLWSAGGRLGWTALIVNTLGFLFTGDLPLAALQILGNHLHIGTAGIAQKMLTLVLLRPGSIILFVMAIFYLWVYVRCAGDDPVHRLARVGAGGNSHAPDQTLVPG